MGLAGCLNLVEPLAPAYEHGRNGYKALDE
jgi:hypothetical protein